MKNNRKSSSPVRVFTVHKSIICTGNEKQNRNRAQKISAYLQSHFYQYRVQLHEHNMEIKLQLVKGGPVTFNAVVTYKHPARLAMVEQVMVAVAEDHYPERFIPADDLVHIFDQPWGVRDWMWLRKDLVEHASRELLAIDKVINIA